MRKPVLPILLISMLTCPVALAEKTLTISDAEKAGFTKRSQQWYQMVGAVDGWSGRWSDEIVELYQYAKQSEVRKKQFEPNVQEGNISGWVDLCQHHNLLMVSKGKKACVELKSL